VIESYNLLENVLNDIEKQIKKDINENDLAQKYSLSGGYLRRLFMLAFKRPIGAYIRSRKLAASIDDLLHSDLNILDIALDYGFGHEQSYIRAFKREYGVRPGELRRTGEPVAITPPLHLFDYNKLDGGLFFGPDIVMIPQFHVVGKKYKIPCRDVASTAYGIKQLNEAKKHIPNTINPGVLICIATEAEPDADYWYQMPSVQVKNLHTIPDGFDSFTFPSSLCARFRFIGPSGTHLNMVIADAMFKAINDFMDDDSQKYFLERKKINIDRFDLGASDGFFSYWEWFAPVRIKTKDDVPEYAAGIIKTYKQELPALRFIGKKYSEPDFSFKAILDNLDKGCIDHLFEAIEKQSDKDLTTLYEGCNAYTALIKDVKPSSTENSGGEISEYWLGMFMPKETPVPQGCEKIDFPASTIAVCSVYGKRNDIINYDNECREKILEEGLEFSKGKDDGNWFFLRFNWRDYFKEDKFGKRALEYCYYK